MSIYLSIVLCVIYQSVFWLFFYSSKCLFISMSICHSICVLFYCSIVLSIILPIYCLIVSVVLSIVPSIHHLYKMFLYLFSINKLLTIKVSFCLSLFILSGFPQRVCQRKRACGEQERVPQAQTSAADRERTQWISGMDLQSRSVHKTHKQMYRYKLMSWIICRM